MWTNIPKPTGTPYTGVYTQGKQIYDQSDITYDDPNVYYDSINEAAWTGISKPTQTFGYFTWDEMTMTWDEAVGLWSSGWTNIDKPV